MCSLCLSHSEITFHLFFECSSAFSLWCWFASILNLTLHFQSLEDIWHLCGRNWSPQCKITIKAAIINLLNAILYARNNARFNNKTTHWKSAVYWILSSTALAGNNSSFVSSNSTRDFVILKKLNVSLHPPKPIVLKEIIWQPPIPHWIKCNTNGASNNSTSSCGGIFRNHNADFLCAFAENTFMQSAFKAELCGVMRAIEIAANKNWSNFWIETDSNLVVLAFKSYTLVPWDLSNRWLNCIRLTSGMNFVVTHVYREENQCADGLANIGLTTDIFTIWYEIPSQILGFFC
jgi:ribonuclease HI